MSQRCQAIKPNGAQCNLRTLKGPRCYVHALKLGLRVKKSNIPAANMGLFATQDFPRNGLIDEYKGEILEMPTDDVPEDRDYVFSVDENHHIDAGHPNSCYSRFINDSRNTGRRANTKWVVDRRTKTVRVRASRPIKADKKNPQELLISYGPTYWVQYGDRLKSKQKEQS